MRICITIIFLVLVGIIGLVGYTQAQQSTNSITPTPQLRVYPTHIPSPIPLLTQQLTPPSILLLDTSQWLLYTDTADGFSFKYPQTWEFVSPSLGGPSVVSFKPSHATPEQLGGNEYVIAAIIAVNNYQTVVKKIPTEGMYTQETLQIGNLSGIHFIGPSDGYYILNDREKSVEFHYMIINGKDYSPEAKTMAASLIFSNN